MAFSRFLILLSLICSSYAAKHGYIFCNNGTTNGTIITELDAFISIEEGNTTTKLSNIQQTGASETCTSDDKRLFRIDFENGASLKVVIENKNGTVFLNELKVETKNVMGTAFVSKELSSSTEYYVCNHPDTYDMETTSPADKLSVTFNTVKLQGFNVLNGSFSHASAMCSNGSSTTTIKPTIKTSTTLKTTTTSVPSTTTMKPSTTTKTSNSSTSVPSTTTMKPSTTSKTSNSSTTSTKTPITTTSPIMTTTKPHTTSSPAGTSAALDIIINGTVCLLVEFKGNLTFEYFTKEGKTKIYTHEIDRKDVKNITGSCEGDSPYVKGILSMGCAVEFRFSKVSSLRSATRRLLAASFDYALTNLTVTYDTSKPADADNGSVKIQSAAPKDVKASSGQIYKCNAPMVLLSEGRTTLRVEDFKAGAYSPNTNNANVCAADNQGNNVVPIVVGVILACLVVIIIVAYLIGRRRNREGYQSV